MKILNVNNGDIYNTTGDIEEYLDGEYSNDDFMDYLDDAYEPTIINGCTYTASRILKEVDPMHFDTLRCDREGELVSEFSYKLLCSGEGETLELFGYEFEVIEND